MWPDVRRRKSQMWCINACQRDASCMNDGGRSRNSSRSGSARAHRGRRACGEGIQESSPVLRGRDVIGRLIVGWRSRRSRCSISSDRRDAVGHFRQGPIFFGYFSSRTGDDRWVAECGTKLLIFVVAGEGVATGAVGTGSLHVGVWERWCVSQ